MDVSYSSRALSMWVCSVLAGSAILGQKEVLNVMCDNCVVFSVDVFVCLLLFVDLGQLCLVRRVSLLSLRTRVRGMLLVWGSNFMIGLLGPDVNVLCVSLT